jgi:methionyl-tRNA formyltransferase
LRVVYFGTPADSVPTLEAIAEAGHDLAVVVTQPDRKRGRGGALVPSAVRVAAEARGIPVLTPRRASEVVDDVRASGAEVGVVVAFGQLLPVTLLEALPLGFVNVHFSLLPRWRGAAPVERAILAGDPQTGVCVMAVDETLDTGAVYARRVTPIGADETAGELRGRLAALGAELLVETLPRLPDITPEPQVGEVTYAEKLTVDEFRLDPARPAAELARVVRAGNPKPGAWIEVDGTRLKVLRATTEGDRFVPREVQPASKRAMPYEAWRAGWRGEDPFA